MSSQVGNVSESILSVSCSGQSLVVGELLNSPATVLLQYLTWHILVVITDEKNPITLDFQHKHELHTIDPTNTSQIDTILDDHCDSTKPSNLFFIMCSEDCTTNILQQVNVHEYQYQEQGVLTYHHRWLVLTDNKTHLQVLEREAGNITNLSIMLHHEGSADSLLYAVMWEPYGRRLQLCANITNGNLTGEVFPVLKYGLNGRHFILATNTWGPFVSRTLQSDGSYHYVGLCIEILKAVAERMNFTYTWEMPADGQWGGISNGSWTGLVKQLEDKSADIMSAPLAIQTDRAEVMDFSFPFYIEETAIVYKMSSDSGTTSVLFIRPYKWEVWLCVVVLVPFMGFLVWVLQHFKDGNFQRSLEPTETTLGGTLWMTYGEIFAQGAINISKSAVVRVVLIFWILTCVVYAATYSSNLVALLAVTVESTPFKSLEELAVQDQYKYGAQGGTVYPSIFKKSSGVYETMWKRMVQWQSEGEQVLSTSHSTHIDNVKDGGYAYFADATASNILTAESCDLRLFTDNLFPLEYAMGFQNNSAYEREASSIIMMLSQTGLIAKWVRQFWPKQTGCQAASTSSRPIAVSDLSGLLYLIIALLVTAAAVLGVEKLMWKRYKQIKTIKVKPQREDYTPPTIVVDTNTKTAMDLFKHVGKLKVKSQEARSRAITTSHH